MSLLFSIAGIYLLLYVAVLLPPVQDFLCRTASDLLSDKTGGRVTIGYMRISPFNEVELYDVDIADPKGVKVMDAGSIGAGISLNKLIIEQRIVVTFAEVNKLDAHISRAKPDAPLNIQFLIDAFKSKEKKEPTKFDIVLNNVILRNCSVSYDLLSEPAGHDGLFDAHHIQLTDISADLRLPVLKNDEIKVDLRRLTFHEASGLRVNKISGNFHLSLNKMEISDAVVEFPSTKIALPDMLFPLKGWESIDRQLLAMPLSLRLNEAVITPSDFACFAPALEHYRQTMWLTTDVTYLDGDLKIDQFELDSQPGLSLRMRGEVTGLTGPLSEMKVKMPFLKLDAAGRAINSIITDFTTLPEATQALIARLGDVSLDASVSGSRNAASFDGKLSISQGKASINVEYAALPGNTMSFKGQASTDSFELGSLLDNQDFGPLKADVTADITLQGKGIDGINGSATVDVPLFAFKGYSYTNLFADVSKQGKNYIGTVTAADPNLDFDVEGDVTLNGAATVMDATADIRVLNLSALDLGMPHEDINLTGSIEASLTGNNPANIQGYIDAHNIRYSDSKRPEIACENLYIEAQRGELPHSLTINSDYADFSLTGEYDPTSLPAAFRELAAYFMPELKQSGRAADKKAIPAQDFVFSLLVKKDSGLLEKVKSPISLFEDLELTGAYDSRSGKARLNMDIPYLQQGKNRLLRDTHLSLDVDTASNKCLLALSTILPTDKGDVSLGLDASAKRGKVDTDIKWDLGRKRAYRGNVSLTADFAKNEESDAPIVDLTVNRSNFAVNDTIWNIDPGTIQYTDKSLIIKDVKVHRPGQYARIEGRATAAPEDTVRIALNNIDLDYVFETLNIDYVTFGGRASGIVTASSVFSKRPNLCTNDLTVNNITYNHCVLGDARIDSHFDFDRKSVWLGADIVERGHKVARIYGDIFVTRDSLSLFCNADKVNVAFLQPFMAAFCSKVQGRATGDVHLYGTFKDIDLTGKVFADSLRMKIDVLNTWYAVRDSVTLTPGNIVIDNVTVRDRNGHTALLDGRVTHEYFHNPRFDFTFTQARDFLVYDTDASINPIWYGTIYGTGTGTLHGVPGFIDIKVDMTTSPNSVFTFVISDTEEAEAYSFLTFTDKRKEAIEAAMKEKQVAEDPTPLFIREFLQKQKKEQQSATPTRYAMDIRVAATPSSDLTIVMDPIAGDKIKANGSGDLRLSYNSEGELALYGAYTLDRGNYNFTMQDVIVRDFKIRQGSKISFTGDPLAADLDIVAAYKVNTSLTDLDKSFADDRELNRTNVPVEALLKVSGPMQSPEIDFDIELPTLTEDVKRKVKSIISTSDMMNRQIVYLLALNRFYTPDYMGTDGSNNELASVASTTISSQLSSMLGELTPGWSISPYFRTEKGDFSDMEVDLALSSTLLNNRLILNGNFGYRDRATSSTTFIGDFDIEYLLNRSGTLRLKAYNHFNDQNYYLRSALTTQGVGIVFKRDFQHFLPALFNRKKKKKCTITSPEE